MNAQLVWNVWRRILREPRLQHALIDHRPGAPALGELGFSAEEQVAAAAYSAQSEQAKWFVTNYRYRLANSFLNALETGAPLVLRALLAKGLDLQAIGRDFLDQNDWKDYGPFVYSYCLDALRFLKSHPASETPAGLRSLIGLEETAVTMLMGLARPGAAEVHDAGLWTQGRAALYYRSEMRVSAWMRDKKLLGKAALAPGVEHYFVYLPSLDGAHKFSMLPARAVELHQALATPCAPEALADRLEQMGYLRAHEQDHACLKALSSCGAIINCNEESLM